MIPLDALYRSLDDAVLQRLTGRVVKAVGPVLEAELPGARLGGLCLVDDRVRCEVVGFRDKRALLMPFDDSGGIAYGAVVSSTGEEITAPVGDALIGRVLDGLGQPIDGKGPLETRHRRRVMNASPDPLKRAPISQPLHTSVRVLDSMTPLGKGQRVCIMAGSGVGKSTLLGMVARNVTSEINVICLVGERGREVREFIEHNLGPEGMARSVLVVITGDKSPAMQVKGAFLATTIAEHFRDQGRDVLLMMDSLTRFALAQRQIGLAAGEPPTTRGFTPSVFALLPPLLERVGPGDREGSITGVYTVLVEGDDINDPVADAVRGIVDGHIVLSRKLASHGHYPAVDVLESLSRLTDRVMAPPLRNAAMVVRGVLATWKENEELVRLGAYRKGSAADVDAAIELMPLIEAFLQQKTDEPMDAEQTYQLLTEIAKRAQEGQLPQKR